MKNFKAILVIGVVEILIGGLTLVGVFGSLLLGLNTKTPKVLFFVITTAAFSTLIGIGILQFRKKAYQLLLYFSSVILLSKALLFLGVIHMNGALTSFIPGLVRETVSALYHGAVIYYLRKKNVKKIFHI